VVLAYLGRPWRIAAVALGIIVPLYRMYVAAHLTLDLIGGAALGVTVASLLNLLLRPSASKSTAPASSSADTDHGVG
jgi:membrane-associated phospholipid phosphatase